LAYWTGGDWWGIGPGAHSHVGGVRWWNVKHPAAWQRAVLAGQSPAAGREVLDGDAETLERVLLGIRIVDGLPIDQVPLAGRGAVPDLVRAGLVDPMAATASQIVLTREGRLLADTVVRALVP
jgi:oxygen-independent coproporphyrinogen-3 oxidase